MQVVLYRKPSYPDLSSVQRENMKVPKDCSVLDDARTLEAQVQRLVVRCQYVGEDEPEQAFGLDRAIDRNLS